MDIFFADPSEIPLPPDEVRIRELRVDPGADSSRVRVYLAIDPFQKKPSLDLAIYDPSGQEIAATSIIESVMNKIQLTILLRGKPPAGIYRLALALYYANYEQLEEEGGLLERQVVDTREINFSIDGPD